MIQPPVQLFFSVLVMALVTLAIRALPFLLFPANKKTPAYIVYLGKVLPFATIGMLVIYCLKGTQLLVYPYAIPEIVAIAVVVALQLWKRNILLSISSGTVLYMILLQNVDRLLAFMY